MSPFPALTLTTRELATATGATLRQLQYWEEQGLLRCSKRGRREFAATELALARLAVYLPKFPKARRGIIAAIRRRHTSPPFYVVSDRLGKRVRFADSKAEVVALATAARYGVLLVEVKP
jgi:hypothetical protein